MKNWRYTMTDRDEEMMVNENGRTGEEIKCDICQTLQECNYLVKSYEDNTEELIAICEDCNMFEQLMAGLAKGVE